MPAPLCRGLSDSCLVKSDELANRDILRVVLEGIASDLLAVEVDVAIEHELYLARQVLGIFALEQQSDFRRDDVEGPPSSLAMTGAPQASASMATSPKGSLREVSNETVAQLYR